ncbi:ankyrin repeat protein [Apiospora sp. TS-2023a]
MQHVLLDHVDPLSVIPTRWPICNYHGADKLWHDHFVLQVRRESHQTGRKNCYRKVRRAVTSYCSETGADLAETIDAVCWLGLYWARGLSGMRDEWNSRLWTMRPLWESCEAAHTSRPYCCHPSLDLLCMAAYLGHESLVQKLLDEGAPPFCYSHIFASPMQLAALAGRGSILRQLQERVAIWGAANAGLVDILDLAVQGIPSVSPDATSASNIARAIASSGTDGDTTSSAEEAQGTSSSCIRVPDATWEVMDAVWNFALFETPNLEMLRSLFPRAGRIAKLYTILLSTYTRYGNVEIVRYLLDQGANVSHSLPHTSHALCEACRHGHEAIVDVLLEARADVNLASPWRKRRTRRKDKYVYKSTTPLAQAAAGGSLAIVRKLLARGAQLTGDAQPLWNAVRLEHTEMFELLMSLDPPVSELAKFMMRKRLSGEGLEPMMKLKPVDWESADEEVRELD